MLSQFREKAAVTGVASKRLTVASFLCLGFMYVWWSKCTSYLLRSLPFTVTTIINNNNNKIYGSYAFQILFCQTKPQCASTHHSHTCIHIHIRIIYARRNVPPMFAQSPVETGKSWPGVWTHASRVMREISQTRKQRIADRWNDKTMGKAMKVIPVRCRSFPFFPLRLSSG